MGGNGRMLLPRASKPQATTRLTALCVCVCVCVCAIDQYMANVGFTLRTKEPIYPLRRGITLTKLHAAPQIKQMIHKKEIISVFLMSSYVHGSHEDSRLAFH